MTTKNSTTAPSSHYLQSSNMSCHQFPKQNWLHSTTVANLGPHLHNSQRNGTSTAQMHHDHHRQHHCQKPHHGHYGSKGIKIDGSMLPLAQMPQCTTPIPLPLVLWQRQSCQSCKQASSSKTSPSSPSILHLGHSTTPMNYFPMSILICSPCVHTS
jgi:hypothetical protein